MVRVALALALAVSLAGFVRPASKIAGVWRWHARSRPPDTVRIFRGPFALDAESDPAPFERSNTLVLTSTFTFSFSERVRADVRTRAGTYTFANDEITLMPASTPSPGPILRYEIDSTHTPRHAVRIEPILALHGRFDADGTLILDGKRYVRDE